MEKFDLFLYLYGDRGIKEIDIETKWMKNDPKKIFAQIKLINVQNNIFVKLEERKKEAYRVLSEEAEKMGKLKNFEKQANIYENIFGFREAPKYLFVLMVGIMHDLTNKIGKNFVKEGRLDDYNDIYKLHIKDITNAQDNLQLDLRHKISLNMKPYTEMAMVKHWPTNIDSRGKIYAPIRKSKDGDLLGEAISSGIVIGRAKVLNNPYEKKVEQGEILVTHATEPSWTPIFINASGVVHEVEGVLQHGAIIAREYGLPCVSGIRKATTLIKNGDLLEVNGFMGTVRIICEDE